MSKKIVTYVLTLAIIFSVFSNPALGYATTETDVNKAVAAKQENLDIFIDDSFKNCQMVADLGIKTFIMDTEI